MIRVLADKGAQHPAIDRALSAFPEDSARRAAAALEKMMYERIATDGERAWSSSRLTGDGFPVEFTFTTADDLLRYTVEPASLHVTPQRRFDTAIRLINSLGPFAIAEDMIAALRTTQNHGDLCYGSWLGGRHGPDHNEYKIYVETPDADTACDALEARLFAFPKPSLPDRVANLRMIAYLPASQQWEVYFRVKSMAPHHIPRVLAPCGLDARAGELLSYITSAYGYSLGDRLPGPSVGVSYSMRSPENLQSITLFFFARVLWGADARIRKEFGRLSRKQGWDDSRYQKITAELASSTIWTTHHGIFGINLTRNGQLSLSIGVRPPGAIQ